MSQTSISRTGRGVFSYQQIRCAVICFPSSPPCIWCRASSTSEATCSTARPCSGSAKPSFCRLLQYYRCVVSHRQRLCNQRPLFAPFREFNRFGSGVSVYQLVSHSQIYYATPSTSECYHCKSSRRAAYRPPP